MILTPVTTELNLKCSARKTSPTTTERFVREVFKPAICECKSSSTSNSKRVIFLSQLIVNGRLQGRFRHTSLTVYVRRKKENEFYHCLHSQRPTENKYLLLRNVNLFEKSKVCISYFVSWIRVCGVISVLGLLFSVLPL